MGEDVIRRVMEEIYPQVGAGDRTLQEVEEANRLVETIHQILRELGVVD